MFDHNENGRRVSDVAFGRLKSGALTKVGIFELREVAAELFGSEMSEAETQHIADIACKFIVNKVA